MGACLSCLTKSPRATAQSPETPPLAAILLESLPTVHAPAPVPEPSPNPPESTTIASVSPRVAKSPVSDDPNKSPTSSSQGQGAQSVLPKTPSKSLWDAAYKKLRETDCELVEAFELLLLRLDLSDDSATLKPEMPSGGNDRVRLLKTAVQHGLERTDKWAKAMEKAGTVSDVLKAVGDIIQSTLSASVPQAGAAWMGVSILLKGLSNAAGESAANREGILYVGSRFGWYRQLFSILDSLAGGQLGELRQQLEAMAIDLFAKIFTYQMSSVGDYFRSQLSVTICNAFRARDWARDLGAIKDCEEGLRECLKQYDNRTEIKHLSDLARTAFSLEAGMTRQLAELGEIRRVQAELLAVQRAGAEKKELDEAYKLIGKFKVSGLSYEEFMDRNPDPAEGTCGWFLKDDRVLDWEKGGKKLLLVKAMPGQGKSVLARALVKKWRNGGQATVCHFFKDTNLIQKRADMALCAILHQILTKDPSLALKVKNEINQGGEGLPGSMTDLWNLLEVVTLLVKEPIICIFDALDECDDEHPQMLLDRLSTFCNAEETRNPKLKILATTRPIDRIINKFRNVPNIGLNPNDSTILASEIESVIKMRVGTMAKEKGWSNELRIRIEESLRGTGTPQNTYLWLRLIFELLDKEPALPDEDWLTLITELPPTVNGAYEKLLRSVDAKRKFYVRELLSIMICAATPLTAEEVNIALRVASGTMN